MKRCASCHQDLPESAYSKDSDRPGGLYPYCRACSAEKQALRKQGITASYTPDELLTRPLEHILEQLTTRQLAQALDCDRNTACKVKAEPWEWDEDELSLKLRSYLQRSD